MHFERTDGVNIGAPTISPTQIQANRYDLLSRVVAGLAHEVKNPIHAAVINLELLRRRVAEPDPEMMLERIGLLEQQVGRVHELVDALFRFLRPTNEPVRWIDIDDAIGAIMPIIHAYGRVARMEFSYTPAGGAMADIDRAALQQIMLNLVVNSVDAMRPAHGEIRIRGAMAGEEIHLRISDTGPGAPAGTGPAHAEPGVDSRTECAGLGLAIARHLAEEAGGRIDVEETDGGTGGTHLLLVLRRAACA